MKLELEIIPDASISCERCGQLMNANTLATRKLRGNQDKTCADCNRRPASVVTYGSLKCTPWSGEIDLDTMQPLKNGKPYLPGERTCGHADCVRLDHIIATQPAEGFKTCSTCLESLPLDSFGIDRKKKDGRNFRCKDCRRGEKKRSRTPEELTAEQFSLYYRTKKQLTFEQLMNKLENERREIAWESSRTN